MDARLQYPISHYPFSLTGIGICSCLGMVAAVLSPVLPSLSVSAFLFIAGIFLCWPRWKKCCVAIGWFLLGYCWSASFCQNVLDELLPVTDENLDIDISGHLIDFPNARERGWQFDFYADQLKGKIRLSIYAPYNQSADESIPAPQLDCHYRLRVQLKRPRGLINFGLYDYQSWLLQGGYLATGYIRNILECEKVEPARLLAWRAQISDNIKSVAMSNYASSTLRALLIGSYSDIDMLQWQILRDSGTIHLLSVSGLHIVLIAVLTHFFVFHLCRLLVLPVRFLPADMYGSCAALFFAIFYAYLAGFSVATQRSLIMVAVAVVQRFLYGRFQFGAALLIALLLVLLSNPLSILSSGFWFSFWATTVLIYSTRIAGELLKTDIPAWCRWVVEAVRPQWLVFVMLSPMLLYVYGRMPLLSMPLNFFAVPWVSFLSLPIAFVALALFPVSDFLAVKLLQLSAWTLDVYWYVMQWGIRFGNNLHVDLGGISLVTLVPALAGLCLLFLLPARWNTRRIFWRSAGVMLCLPMLLHGSHVLRAGEAEMTLLDVGQGLSVIVRTTGHVLVYDTGDRRSERFDVGRDIVAPALRNLRTKKIDMLVLSHSDSDHAGGAPGLLREFNSSSKWSGTPDTLQQMDGFLQCRAGMHWRWDDVDFVVVHPSPENGREITTNNRGCVIKVSAGQHSILLAADIEQPAEQAILSRSENIRADILVSPHHGSKTSSSETFLDAVDAKIAVISSGFHNRYRHPSPEVVSRYQKRAMQVFNTTETGAVRMRLLQSGLQTELAVCDTRYFWRDQRYCQSH